MQWTSEDPGAGELQTLRDAQNWFSKASEATENVYQVLRRVRDSLPYVWTGESASAFAESMNLEMKRLSESKEVTVEVATAFKRYVDEVEEIKEKAKRLIADRDAARLALNATYLDGASNPPDDAEMARRSAAYTKAQDEHDTAVSGLKDLAELRQSADDAFTRSALASASDAWGELKGLPARSGFENPKYSGNDQAWELFSQFQSGDGPRHRFFTDGDPITEWLRQSEHVRNVRAAIRKALLDGLLVAGGEPGEGNRKISDNGWVYAGDVFTAISGGEAGNLPESVMGSYVMSYVVNSIDENGNAEVTFTVANPMTRDSFTRIPGTGGAHLPWYESLNDANRDYGTWADSTQTFVWTETIRRPER